MQDIIDTIISEDINIKKMAFTYDCQYCEKKYKNKKSYDKHNLLCNVIRKTPKERKLENEIYDSIPNMREMYNIIQQLIVKNDKLEKQVNKMSSWIHNNKKKINVIDWLNDNSKPLSDYNSWIETIDITANDMETFVKYNYIEGINQIIRKLIETSNINMDVQEIPIRAFEQKENSLFIFNGTNWEIMSSLQMEMIFKKISKGLLSQLKAWQDKNKHRLSGDSSFSDIYIQYVKKIIAGDMSREQQQYKIKQCFYNNLKVNIKNIIQYEFEF